MKFDITFSELDADLNGEKGVYRAKGVANIIGLNTDRDAVNAFLHEYSESPATFRSYVKEVDRLMVWSVIKQNKPISSMTRDDFNDYIEFLKSPDPEWCGPKMPKSSEDWRPFTGPLSQSAIRSSIAIINSLMSWLVNAGYLSGNPLGLIRDKKRKSHQQSSFKKVERFLDEDMWASVLHTIESLPVETKAERCQMERMRFMLTFFSLLGARVSELSNSKMVDFKSNVAGWFWEVVGKGQKEANVAMPKDMVEALMRWRKFLGLSALPKNNELIPAVPVFNKNWDPMLYNSGISPRRVNQLLKEYFALSAKLLEDGGQEDKAEKLKMASAHWLRHTAITQKINAGIDRRITQTEARHSDARTTGLYTHDEETERYNEAQKHKINWSDKDKESPAKV